MATSVEREVLYRIRVAGADGLEAAFKKAGEAASKSYQQQATAAKRASDDAQKAADASARFEQKVANDTYRLKMKVWKDQQREQQRSDREAERAARAKARAEERAAEDAVRQHQRAAAEAERSARRVEHLQDQATKKFMAGTQQAVSAITSLLRSAVLAWAANEEEAEKMLRTLAGFEAGAQLFQGTIDALQSLVTLWEAAEAASKAYALAEAAASGASAASGAARAVSAGTGVATTAVAAGAAGAAGGAAATGGVWGTVSGAMGWAASSAASAATALAPFAAAVAAGTAALGELIYRTTGNESFSVGGAFQGAMSLLGFGGERDRTPGQLAWQQSFARDRTLSYGRSMVDFERDSASRSLRNSGSFLNDSPSSQLDAMLSQRSEVLGRIINTRWDPGQGGSAAGANDAAIQNRAKLAQEALTIEEKIYNLRRMAAEESASALQKQLQTAKSAVDAAEASYASIQDRQRSTYERVANMNREEQAVFQSALLKDRSFAGGKKDAGMSLPEANMLRGFGLGDKSTETLFRKEAESAVPALAAIFREALDKAELASMEERLKFDSLSAGAGKDLKISGTVDAKMEITVRPDLAGMQEASRKILEGLKPVIEQGLTLQNDESQRVLSGMHSRK